MIAFIYYYINRILIICKEWVGAPVDPNDPRNTNVIHLMRRNVVDLRDGLAFSTEPHELLLLVFADLFLK